MLGKGVCLLGATSSWLRVQETSCTFSGVPAAASRELALASGSSGLHAHDHDCTEVVFKAVIYCVSVHACRCGSGSQWGGREMHPDDSYPVPLDSALTWKPRMGFWGRLKHGFQSRVTVSEQKQIQWLTELPMVKLTQAFKSFNEREIFDFLNFVFINVSYLPVVWSSS